MLERRSFGRKKNQDIRDNKEIFAGVGEVWYAVSRYNSWIAFKWVLIASEDANWFYYSVHLLMKWLTGVVALVTTLFKICSNISARTISWPLKVFNRISQPRLQESCVGLNCSAVWLSGNKKNVYSSNICKKKSFFQICSFSPCFHFLFPPCLYLPNALGPKLSISKKPRLTSPCVTWSHPNKLTRKWIVLLGGIFINIT